MSVSILGRCVVGLVLLLVMLGCSTPGENVKFKDDIYIASAEGSGFQEVGPEGNSARSSQSKTEIKRVEYIEGSGVFTKDAPSPAQIPVRRNRVGPFTFKNTDIRIVVRAVLKDTLQIDYNIDPRVQGKVTLETSGQISKEALQLALESLLNSQGYALVAASDGYHVLPLNEAPRNVESLQRGRPSSADLPGFGVRIVPLQHTLPSEMQKILEPFSSTDGVLRADDERQILILAGTTKEMATMLRAIDTFDVDTMTGKTVAIFTLRYVEADVIVDELKEVFGTGGEEASLIRFVPIPRINRLIAIASRRDALKQVETWVEKLDLGESAPGRRIYVYQVMNGRAGDIADTLNLILGNQFGNYGRNTGFNGSQRSSQRRSSGRSQQNQFSNRQGLGSASTGDGFGDEGVRIVPSEENNSIVIMATPSEFAAIETALKQIDVPPRQVLIEVTLAEVGLTDELRYGLQWQFDFADNAVAFGKSASPSPEFPGFSWVFARGDTSAVLNAIESVTDLKVVSSPKLLVLNNETGTLQVGDEVPVPTTSSQSTSNPNAPIINNIQYRNTGVILNVTPRINDGGLIMLDIDQELSSVVETASSGIDAPTIQQRKISSSIAVQSGSTIALGGLIRNSVTNTKSGIPLLKDIPLLGNAFRSNSLVERRTELVVLLTPRIIRNIEETRGVMDELRKEFRALMAEEKVGE